MTELVKSTKLERDGTNVRGSNVTSIDAQENRVVINKQAFLFHTDSMERRALVKAINATLVSDWFSSRAQQSQTSYKCALKPFLVFMQSLSAEQFTSKIFADFVAYRTNVAKVKIQSTNVNTICLCVEKALNLAEFSSQQVHFLQVALRHKPKTIRAKRKQVALADFFLELPWFRSHLTTKELHELSNQKNLMGSFTTTLAAVLIEVIQTKKSLVQSYQSKFIPDDSHFGQRTKTKYHIERIITLSKAVEDKLKARVLKLIQLDIINKSKYVEDTNNPSDNFVNQFALLTTRGSLHTPDVLGADYLLKPSKLEQCLMAFLLAAQAIQPSNVGDLQAGNIIEVKNSRGETVDVYIKYFKTRAGAAKITPYLSYQNSIVAKALINYKKYFSEQNSRLFSEHFDPKAIVHYSQNPKKRTLVNRFLLSLEIYHHEIELALQRAGFTGIISKSFGILRNHGGISHSEWRTVVTCKQDGNSYSRYRTEVTNYLPAVFIRLGSIKTSAVYATADRFDKESIQNFNSHSNSTEFTHYLNDGNQDWQDRNGQVTRLVYADMQRYAFRPRLNPTIDSASDLLERTTIVSTSLDSARTITTKGFSHPSMSEKSKGIERVVIDSEETVVMLKHYIDQAQVSAEKIYFANQHFFEWELLPNVEWAEAILSQKIPQKTVRKGMVLYHKIKDRLPDLFTQKAEGRSH